VLLPSISLIGYDRDELLQVVKLLLVAGLFFTYSFSYTAFFFSFSLDVFDYFGDEEVSYLELNWLGPRLQRSLIQISHSPSI
jgi:hypothetical protein